MGSEYNGWTNYETWNANLWITNDSADSERWEEEATDALRAANDEPIPQCYSRRDKVKCDIADALEADFDDQAEELIGSIPSGFFADMVNASLREINWREIADHFVDQAEWTIAGEQRDEIKDRIEDLLHETFDIEYAIEDCAL